MKRLMKGGYEAGYIRLHPPIASLASVLSD